MSTALVKLLKLRKLLVSEGIPAFAAGLYDRVARGAREGYYSTMAEEVASEIEAGRLLDVGTGPGYLPIEIAKRCSLVQIDGIDVSGRMIELARGNAREAGVLRQVHFEKGNANRLRFKDNSYELVVSSGVFHSWKDPVRAINEIYRVLRPGRVALIYDPASLAGGFRALQQPLPWRDKLALKWVEFANWVWPRSYTVESVRDILSQTRFRDFSVSQKELLKVRLRKTVS